MIPSVEKAYASRKKDEIIINRLNKFKMYVYKNLLDNTEHLALVRGKIMANETTLAFSGFGWCICGNLDGFTDICMA